MNNLEKKCDKCTHKHNNSKDHASHEHSMTNPNIYLKKLFVSVLISIPILLLSPSLQQIIGFQLLIPYQELILIFLSSILFFYSGFLFIEHAYHELKMKKPGMMMLIALAISVAYVFSLFSTIFNFGNDLFWELATLIVVMLLGHYIEAISIARAKDSLKKLAELIPKKAHRLKGKRIEDVDSTSLARGDIIIVKPGERIPADGEVVKGSASVDESLISGESKPVNKRKGDKVIGGSVSLGSLTIRVEKSGKELYISHVIDIVRQAQNSKYKTQDLANKAAGFLFYLAVFSAFITYEYWTLVGKPFDAVERAIAVLVIACPHALGLAIPLVVAISTSLSASSGVLIRRKDAFEKLRDVKYVFFDKTGTLTEGNFRVVDVICKDKKKLIEKVASIEVFSEHLIAQAIVNYSKTLNVKLHKNKIKNFKYHVGRGVEANYGKEKLYIGNRKMMEGLGIKKIPKEREGTTIYVSNGKSIEGIIILNDPLKRDAKKVVRELKNRNIEVVMLTGDNEKTAAQISSKLGIKYNASLLPEEKASIVEEYKKKGTVVFVGDGINDTISLTKADVGIAMNSLDVVANIGDIILTKNDITMIYKLIDFSKIVYRKMVENLIWATFYNIFAIPAAAGVFLSYGVSLSPALGALFMSFSTVVVAINAGLLNSEKKLFK